MTVIILAIVFGLLLLRAMIRADARFRHCQRLPMQWSLTGAVTWSAPRRVALAFIPALAGCVLAVVAGLALAVAPRPGQEGLVLPVFLTIGAGFVAIQQLHIRLIGRTLQSGRGW